MKRERQAMANKETIAHGQRRQKELNTILKVNEVLSIEYGTRPHLHISPSSVYTPHLTSHISHLTSPTLYLHTLRNIHTFQILHTNSHPSPLSPPLLLLVFSSSPSSSSPPPPGPVPLLRNTSYAARRKGNSSTSYRRKKTSPCYVTSPTSSTVCTLHRLLREPTL